MKIKLLSAVFLLTLFLGGCKVPQDITYFQGLDELSPEQLALMNKSYYSRVVPDDLLTITVTSWDANSVAPFNPPVYVTTMPGESEIQQSQQLHTYLVDKDGFINFPVLGKVRAGGLTKQELTEYLQTHISEYVSDALVNIQIVNFKVTVLGEVTKPGTIDIKNDRVSILDALGQAQDMTINGNRKNVLVIRDVDGEKEYGRLDLTQPDIFASPFYYLTQNDVVYVEPNNARKKNSTYSQADQFKITIMSSVLGAVSTITTMVILLVDKFKKDSGS
ncbi:polysaccharide biosynthesis/export family protein [Parabacteroides sp. PF5-9]|uniref:polysaccharide biosynthesis/export family protein n=1 Tax=Parabacteroides sp. PF5-9 TaxID=1742404 RepID=UPI002476522F|nr:polysaccharide biosynthesis/export family protein [Parabacteroides sp. PF5-9]MDH6358241.1 polysaccharide export outer membrane protein [Parabacteroides sp. PF5-9]